MIRVAIVDDENLVRLGLRSAIDWQGFGYEIVGEAADGLSGLELIRRQVPDLVFLDIAMPNMDGISLLKAMKEEGIDHPQVVVLSCHDDFEYVRKSMEYGAGRYILKNEINAASIRALLELLKGELSQIRKAKRGGPEEAGAGACRKILSGQALSKDERALLCGAYRHMACAVFSVREYAQVLSRYEPGQEAVFASKVMGLCLEWARTVAGYEIRAFAAGDNRYLLLFLPRGDAPGGAPEIASLLTGLYQVLCGYLNVDIRAGLGEVHALPQGLERGIIEGDLAHGMHFFRQDGFLVCGRAVDILRHEQVRALMYALHEEALGRHYRGVQSLMERLFALCGQIAREAVFDAADVRNCALNMLRLSGIQKQDLRADALFALEESGAFLEAVRRALESAAARAQSLPEGHSALTAEAARHIGLHYAEHISLNTIARALHVSKSHLCRVFSREMGVPLHQYLNEYRVDRAKELIRSSDLKMYDIALQTGFQNTAHFNVTFKKIVKTTPVAYRRENGVP